MKIQSRILSIIIAAAMAAASLPLTAFAADTSETENLILFGSYPQSEVKDENLLSSLNGIATEWTSYDYYSGTGIYDDGKMSASDFMKYADVELGGSKYRGVVFDEYRPTFTGYSLTNDTDTYQDNNGYECGKTYWFKFEPLRWRVINPENGYVICDSIIDSQPFSNFLYFNGSAYYMDTLGYDFSNYYVNSSIRSWLNADFADTAFSPEEKENIVTNYMDDFWKDIYDKVFLPSANEMKITEHWKDDASKIAAETDYAKCQGLFVSEGISYWRLRSPSDWSHAACAVCTDGTLYGRSYYYNVYPYFTSFTGTGIRPAIKLVDINDNTVVKSEFKAAEYTAYKKADMKFFEKVKAFFGGICSTIRYFLSRPDEINEDVISVKDSLKRGINVTGMDAGWPREMFLEKETFENISEKGFDFIRLPANLCCMLDDNGSLNESAAYNLDKTLKYALESDLSVILELHGWEDLNNDPSTQIIEKLVSVWKQVAERYKDYPDKLMLEILNEPNNNSGKMTYARWNYIQNKVTAAIREIDEDRIIVLASKNFNVSSSLNELRINHRDPYLIIDVHNYSPMEFTHQGAEWMDDSYQKSVPYSKEAADEFAAAVKLAADYQEKHGTKVVVGEIGVYLKQVDEKEVNAFLTDAVNCLKEYNLPYAYWEYCAGFGAYNLETKQWKPYVTDALLK